MSVKAPVCPNPSQFLSPLAIELTGQGIAEREKEMQVWKKLELDYDRLQTTLCTLPNETSYDIMVCLCLCYAVELNWEAVGFKAAC